MFEITHRFSTPEERAAVGLRDSPTSFASLVQCGDPRVIKPLCKMNKYHRRTLFALGQGAMLINRLVIRVAGTRSGQDTQRICRAKRACMTLWRAGLVTFGSADGDKEWLAQLTYEGWVRCMQLTKREVKWTTQHQ